jgi:hypothetical protein
MVCNVCGGRGHKGQDCATAKLTTPRPGDGTSKPKTNVDREFTFRDSAGTNSRGTSKRGTARLKRRLSAEEWADLPFIKGTTKPCSVTAGGKVCGGEHRHAKCPMLPAAKAEKAAKAAVSGKSAAIFTLPGQDPGQAPAVMRVAAAPPYRRSPDASYCPPCGVYAPVVPAESAAWKLGLGVVLQVLFVLLLITVVHVVVTVPATGAVDRVVGVVTSQPVYSFKDVAVSSMALFVLGGSASDVGVLCSRC